MNTITLSWKKFVIGTAALSLPLLIASSTFAAEVEGQGTVQGEGTAEGETGAVRGEGTASGSGLVFYRDENGNLRYKRGTGTVEGQGVGVGTGSATGEGAAAGEGSATGEGSAEQGIRNDDKKKYDN